MAFASIADDFPAVLDACALFPFHLRTTLLRLAAHGLYRPLWSADIRAELCRSLARRGVAATSIERTESRLSAFPNADVQAYGHLIESMTCHQKDRHVLAAAVKAEADVIVTFNLRDFPPESVERHRIEVQHPDDFLLNLHDLNPNAVRTELQAQADRNSAEPRTLTSLLDALANAGVPKFAESVRDAATSAPPGEILG